MTYTVQMTAEQLSTIHRALVMMAATDPNDEELTALVRMSVPADPMKEYDCGCTASPTLNGWAL